MWLRVFFHHLQLVGNYQQVFPFLFKTIHFKKRERSFGVSYHPIRQISVGSGKLLLKASNPILNLWLRNHFHDSIDFLVLIGKPKISLPDTDITKTPTNRLSKLKEIQLAVLDKIYQGMGTYLFLTNNINGENQQHQLNWVRC